MSEDLARRLENFARRIEANVWSPRGFDTDEGRAVDMLVWGSDALLLIEAATALRDGNPL